MKKLILSVLILSLFLTGCHFSKSMTYNVETGDKVEAKLDTTKNNYNISDKDGHFILHSGKDVIGEGCFSTKDVFLTYKEIIHQDQKSYIVEELDDKLIYGYVDNTHSEYNFIIMISDKTSVFISFTDTTWDTAYDIFGKLMFSIK